MIDELTISFLCLLAKLLFVFPEGTEEHHIQINLEINENEMKNF